MPHKEYDKRIRIVVGEIGDRTVGFIVDAVSEIIRLPADKIEPAPNITADDKAEYILGVGKLDVKLLMLLDIDKILSGSEKDKLFEAAEA